MHTYLRVRSLQTFVKFLAIFLSLIITKQFILSSKYVMVAHYFLPSIRWLPDSIFVIYKNYSYFEPLNKLLQILHRKKFSST